MAKNIPSEYAFALPGGPAYLPVPDPEWSWGVGGGDLRNVIIAVGFPGDTLCVIKKL